METTIDERAREAATAVYNAAMAACRQAAALPCEALCEDTVENLTYLADGAAFVRMWRPRSSCMMDAATW